MKQLPEYFDFDVSGRPELPRLPGVFVTGTDTEVGKTVIAGAIARSLRKAGRSVEAFKPAASGCRHTSVGLVSEDAEFLAACADSNRALTEITPIRMAAALAPNVAAELKKQPVDLEEIFQAYTRLAGVADAIVVEGIGGLLCPISNDFWVIHLAKMMALPLVIVARPNLGTINHTLLTIWAARSAGIHVAGVIINRYQVEPNLTDAQARQHSDAVLAMHTNPAQIAQRGRVPILALVPDDPDCNVAEATIGQDTQFAIDQVDWPGILGLPPRRAIGR
ncbi:MAG: dethiobiotin synthase [Phycisphaerae bacterium]|nr:dethiobiotin synthase [Phycisphaerae bacterium]